MVEIEFLYEMTQNLIFKRKVQIAFCNKTNTCHFISKKNL